MSPNRTGNSNMAAASGALTASRYSAAAALVDRSGALHPADLLHRLLEGEQAAVAVAEQLGRVAPAPVEEALAGHHAGAALRHQVVDRVRAGARRGRAVARIGER